MHKKKRTCCDNKDTYMFQFTVKFTNLSQLWSSVMPLVRHSHYWEMNWVTLRNLFSFSQGKFTQWLVLFDEIRRLQLSSELLKDRAAHLCQPGYAIKRKTGEINSTGLLKVQDASQVHYFFSSARGGMGCISMDLRLKYHGRNHTPDPMHNKCKQKNGSTL